MLLLLRRASTFLGLFTLLTGAAYPLAVTAVAQCAFPAKANGSLLQAADGRIVGSSLIGQPFDDPRYLWGRPSATAPFPYNAAASGASNLGPSNPALADAVGSRIAAVRVGAAVPASTPVPVDLVTSSASGLDPDLSPKAALFQVRRVARSRGLDEERVRELVLAHVTGRTFGVFGEPRVNVLQLNMALDQSAWDGAHRP